MIYVNSETILKIDLFSLLIYGRVIHIWDVLFLTITYTFLTYHSFGYGSIYKSDSVQNPEKKCRQNLSVKF